MKRLILPLITIVMLCSIAAMGYTQEDDQVTKRLMEQPRTVLKEARQALEDARSTGRSPQFVEALMQLSAAQLLIDSDSITTVVREIKEAMDNCASPVERSVIAIYLCDLYRYAQDINAGAYRNSYIPDNQNMATWSIRNYSDAIDSLRIVAVAPAQQLQDVPIARYRSVIGIEGYDGKDAWKLVTKFYPTMYDFILTQIIADDADAHSFIDDAISFHSRRGAARFVWQLKKITAGCDHMSDHPQRAIAALDSLIAQYARHDYVIEAVAERAALAVPRADDVLSRRALYEDLQSWIKKYPQYYRTGCLQRMCAELSLMQLHATLPLVNYPHQPIDVELTYSNATEVYYKLERCNNRYKQSGVAIKENILQDLSDVEQWQDVTLLCDSNLSLANEGNALTFDTRQATLSLPSLPCGIYMLTIASGQEIRELPFAVASHLLYGIEATRDELWAVVVDNRSGQPIEGEVVYLLSNQGDTVQSAVTDGDGICRFGNRSQSNYYWLIMKDRSHYPFAVRTDFASPGYRYQEPHIQLFTDRSIYRPGQELHFSALLYRMDSAERNVLSHKEVTVLLRDASYNELWRDTLTTDSYGSVHGMVALPKGATAGDWRLMVEYGNTRRSCSVTVAEYKRPQFSVECNPIEGTYSYGDTIAVTGRAANYSSVPVAHAAVSYTIKRSSWYGYNNEILHSGTTQTDAHGAFAFDFVATAAEESVWRMWGTRYVVDVSVTSPTGETQSNVTVLSISGTSVRFRIELPALLCREEVSPFDIFMVNGEDVVQQLPMQLALYTLTSDSIGEPIGEMEVSEQPIWTHTCDAGESRVQLPLSLMNSGAYRLRVSTHDHSGEAVADSTDFVLYSQHDIHPPVPVAMWLPIDNITVDADEVATLRVGSSYPDASLMYIIKENDNIVDAQRIALNNSIATIQLPYCDVYGDGVRVELILVRDKTIYNEHAVIYRRQPDLNLIITPTTFRDRTQPGNSEKWQFTVRDAKGNPVEALFMAELYDASLDALRSHSWHFHPHYSLYVPYINISRYWNYHRTQGSYISYYTQYKDAKSYNTVVPFLNNYINGGSGNWMGEVYYAAQRVNGTSLKMTNAYGREESVRSMSYDMAVATVEEESISEEISDAQAVPHSPIQYRANMNETAFFYPHLTTDKSGHVVIEFTMPEANTTWNFISLAVTPTLQNAMYNATVVSNKPLMVSPNMPRFVRQGDRVVLSMDVQNMTDKALNGQAELTLYNPQDERVITSFKRAVAIEAKGASTLRFEIDVPHDISLLGVRVGASTAMYSDGEQHVIAVLPATQLMTEAHPFYISPSITDTTIVFTAMQQNMQRPSVDNYRVTLEYCDNPAWYAVTALPPLVQPSDESATAWMASLYANTVAGGIVRQNPLIASVMHEWLDAHDNTELTSPLMKNEELKQIVLSQTPWLLDATNNTQQMHQIASLLDSAKIVELSRMAVDHLDELQCDNGGWSWFKNMPASYWMTLNILNGLSRLESWGETSNDEAIARMELDGLRYIDSEYMSLNKQTSSDISYLDLCYLYVRSFYANVPMSQELLSVHRKQLKQLAQEWYRLDEIEKAYAAIVFHRHGYTTESIAIINSLREYATIHPQQGMFWANNRSSAYYRNSAIQVHCAIYEAFELIDSKRSELDLMRQWLLMQKQTQSWGNQPSTLDAVRILLASGSNWLGQNAESTIEWGGKTLSSTTQAESVMGLGKWSREGRTITDDDAQVSIGHHQAQPSWGAIYWQYYDDITHVTAQGSNEITLQRRYYVKRDGKWMPIDTTTLQVGDEVLVRLEFYTDRDMQFMTLNDPRPACFEPVQQLPCYTSTSDVWYYSVPSDAANTFYFDHLTRGTHVVQYHVYVDREGCYQSAVATLQSYYAPQFTAHTDGAKVTVLN
ncbi:MAG: hypothetical protein IKM35_05870 [Bacteroidaceae bacterium]|nr:hypothetical protein [Bacteroidaceae bacterium]